ncbi:ESCRT-II subunit protein SNF8 KNAG_0D02410 [Huiozyma naganishii CBS 8797]|uniref:Vacuolar-sorting protein SNF8 n=1 Tax=Huiozyma naganishii (strain ATCC MYA-139 / BCRC 22969 / CBS 8797 / KCTC 17520 / NBRC 10181 / NCYC 3082 / Yp74L-3) TaxID=1071383 RepID=J7S6Y5_HUIN7|nr:hypothetical protein KNAG_0D02410 [Kazachstania naganishii CBS 8797]CCK69991.1 hypothetical protein KNAG_0D02410 [Kazachstania naganishii CBS 8797]
MKKFGVAAFEQNDSSYDDTLIQFNKQSGELKEQLKVFQDKLTEFAQVHNDELKSNPEFRSKFMRMCNTIGIDPLSIFINKDKHLFTVNDFIYELSIKIIQICRETKDINGGLISYKELLTTFFGHLKVTEEDLDEAVSILSVLDGGFETIKIRNDKILRSIPNELTTDQTQILEICSILGYASVSLLKANLSWTTVRSKSVLSEMVTTGLLWIDDQTNSNELFYWDPSWITKAINQ